MTKEKGTFTATIDFSVMKRDELSGESRHDYKRYKSRCREAVMQVVLEQLWLKTSAMGLTRTEWLRSLSEKLNRGLMKIP